MRRWLWFVVPFALVIAGGAVAGWVLVRGDDGPCLPVDGSFDDLRAGTCVTLRGTAHYDSVVSQSTPDTLFAPATTWYLYGFFPVNETQDKAIRVLVRTRRPPERLVAFETMTVQGRLAIPTRALLPPDTETVLSKRTPYFFDDAVLVLVVDRITSEDGVWDEHAATGADGAPAAR
ncbi:MAG: hypothetical protein H6733_15205 [Alphaproteobacteria bacterium]|nr:hypothetical protein [Alphaproteobacteria bacterium]